MSIEKERRCGFRMVGGLYLVAGGLGEPCHRLPFTLSVCPTCGAGVKQQRSFAWVDGAKLVAPGCNTLSDPVRDPMADPAHCPCCPVCSPHLLGERCGLLWVGEKFYPTPLTFVTECHALGLSKRISHIPKELELGKTWVLLAHPRACPVKDWDTVEVHHSMDYGPGIFRAFIPQRIEMLIWQREATPERLAELEKRGISPVIVPDGDPDHDPKGDKSDEDNGALPLGDSRNLDVD